MCPSCGARSERRQSPRLSLEPPALRVTVARIGNGLPMSALIAVPAGIGYPLLFAFVAAESAGALVPGETSLIIAAALASQGKLSFPLVIAVAAGAAIVGDNIGYLIGRRGLRWLGDRPGRGAAGRRQLIERGEEFFARRGSAAVFFGRWLPGLRVVTSWLAGAERIPWPRFLLWNALGGIAWASTIGALAYVLGRSASGSLSAIGFVGIGVAVVVYLIIRVRRWHARSRKPPADRPSG
jgi:membrane-associated protein